jgi:hypothetical protein
MSGVDEVMAMLTILLALLVVVLSISPFALAAVLFTRARRLAGLDDEIARLVDRSRDPGSSR